MRHRRCVPRRYGDKSVGSPINVHEWDSEVAKIYGELRADMEKTGRVMGTMDQLIAAHAVSKGLVIVTNDAAFVMVNGLLVEDWTKEAYR
ncbi:hypothetical protein M5U04_09775 [Xenorhabdus sp. XENO-1]|nr:PIN domain-containing protein [Xenorhabdus bovienii]MCP9268375.1 hypothetical protein [Xenorhabdus bovienii subsp. africana]